ncbi:MAG: hypothetical protein K0R06_986 [Clostridium sp.]|jgi:hypothetical protein|nr:hypothetical protein [Clostridium sp.]
MFIAYLMRILKTSLLSSVEKLYKVKLTSQNTKITYKFSILTC